MNDRGDLEEELEYWQRQRWAAGREWQRADEQVQRVQQLLEHQHVQRMAPEQFRAWIKARTREIGGVGLLAGAGVAAKRIIDGVRDHPTTAIALVALTAAAVASQLVFRGPGPMGPEVVEPDPPRAIGTLPAPVSPSPDVPGPTETTAETAPSPLLDTTPTLGAETSAPTPSGPAEPTSSPSPSPTGEPTATGTPDPPEPTPTPTVQPPPPPPEPSPSPTPTSTPSPTVEPPEPPREDPFICVGVDPVELELCLDLPLLEDLLGAG